MERGYLSRGLCLVRAAVLIANRQAEIMMRIASEFGFTPASRSRISTPSPESATLFDLFESATDQNQKS